MYLDITGLFESAEPFEYSASIMERGANAGPETWQNAKRDSGEFGLLESAEELEAAREFFGDFGAWEDEEVAAWTPRDVRALMLQYISGDIREMESLCGDDWSEYESLSEAGTVSGRMYRGDDGRITFYIGN